MIQKGSTFLRNMKISYDYASYKNARYENSSSSNFYPVLLKVNDNVGKLVFILCLSLILSQQTQNITYTVKVKMFTTSN